MIRFAGIRAMSVPHNKQLVCSTCVGLNYMHLPRSIKSPVVQRYNTAFCVCH